MLELGIGGYAREKQGGASLKMWKWFFPRAQIVGVDIEDKSFVDQPRITSYLGSQTDRALMEHIVREHGAPTIVIDDGSHRPQDVVDSFAILFPMLADDGLYVIEDMQTSYWPRGAAASTPTTRSTSMAMVRRLLDGLNHEEFLDAGLRADVHRPARRGGALLPQPRRHREGRERRGQQQAPRYRQWYEENAPEFTEP